MDGQQGDDSMENVTTFWYLRKPLDQTDFYLAAVRWNIMKTFYQDENNVVLVENSVE